MKFSIPLLFVFLVFFSCKSAAPTLPDLDPVDSIESSEESSLELFDEVIPAETDDESVSEEFSLEEAVPEETALEEELLIDGSSEDVSEDLSEDELTPELEPVPAEPAEQVPLEPIILPEEPSFPPEPAFPLEPIEAVELPPSQPPTPPPAPPPVPPEPPPFLRPAEPEPLRQDERQEVPMPSTPPPEVPSRIPIEPMESAEEQIVFSRIVRLTVGQLLVIPFRGTGWVYLGELGNRRGISYSSRSLDMEAGTTIGQSFVFVAETAGTYILRFYRQDFIQDYILRDYVQVIVGERGEDSVTGLLNRDRIIAEPRWPPTAGLVPPAQPSAVDPAPTTQAPATETVPTTQAPATETAPISQPSTTETTPTTQPSATETAAPTQPPVLGPAFVPETAPSGEAINVPRFEIPPPVESPDEYVRQARQEFNDGRFERALSILDNMMVHYPFGTDEALWLYGQLLEANSPRRDIRLALEYYHRLAREFPQSSLVQNAQRRITYLERHFFNIR